MSGAERVRLFSAVVPPEDVLSSLRAEVARHPKGAGARRLRWSSAAQWHITLGFYGLDDPEARAAWLRERLTGVSAPTLRLAGGGTFHGVLWIGVFGSGLTELAEAARSARSAGDDREFHAHLTLARGVAPAAIAAWERLLAGYSSAEWTAGEVLLMRSDPGDDGPVYSVVERFRLGRTAGGKAS